jgi:cytochrome b
MILFLLLANGVIGISGWLLTTDWGWGSGALEEVHEISVNIALIAIALHVGAAIYESFHHRENLIRSMFTGYKRR